MGAAVNPVPTTMQTRGLRKRVITIFATLLAVIVLASCNDDTQYSGEIVSRMDPWTVSGPGAGANCSFLVDVSTTANTQVTVRGRIGCSFDYSTQAGMNATVQGSHCKGEVAAEQLVAEQTYFNQSENWPNYSPCFSTKQPGPTTENCPGNSCNASNWSVTATFSVIFPANYTVTLPQSDGSYGNRKCTASSTGGATNNEIDCEYSWSSEPVH